MLPFLMINCKCVPGSFYSLRDALKWLFKVNDSMAQMVLTDIKSKITHNIPLSMLWTTGLSPLIRCGVFSHTDQPFSWHDPSNSKSLGRRKPSLKTDAPLSIQLLINCSAFVGRTKSKPRFWYSTDSVTEEYQYLLVFSHPSPCSHVHHCELGACRRPCVPTGRESKHQDLRSEVAETYGVTSWKNSKVTRSCEGRRRHNNDKVTWDGHGIPSHDGNQPSETMQGDGCRQMWLMFVMLEFNGVNLIGMICILCMVF